MVWIKTTTTDDDAIHDNVASEISAVAAKGSPVNADLVLIEDSAAGNVKKRVQVGNLPGGPGGGGATVPQWMEYLAERQGGADAGHAADDFFDDDDDTPWTDIQISGTLVSTEQYGVMSLKSSGDTANDLNGVLKSLGALSSPLTIETAVRWQGSVGTGSGNVGIGFTDGTTGTDGIAVCRTWAAVAQTGFAAGTLTNFDSTWTNYMTRGITSLGSHLYMRCIWKSANTFRIMISPDGVSWDDIAAADLSRTLTPTHFGLFCSNFGQADAAIASYEYFRVTESDLSA